MGGWARRARAARAGAVVFACVLGLAGAVSAEDSADNKASPEVSEKQIAFGKHIWSAKAKCILCHGWSGNGEGAERAPRPGLSLRKTILTKEQLMEVVQCGRPGTKMPYHDSFAYTDDRCYGMTAADLGEDIPNRTTEGTLQHREIEAVVDYLLAKVVNRGPITKAECEEFWGPGAGGCKKYK